MGTSHRIDRYKVRIFGTDKQGLTFTFASQIIELYSNGAHVATATFYKAGHTPGEDSLTLSHILFNAPADQYPSVIDLLRNEDPVFITWVPREDSKEQNDGNAIFETMREKVGEAEVSEPEQRPAPPDRGPQVSRPT